MVGSWLLRPFSLFFFSTLIIVFYSSNLSAPTDCADCLRIFYSVFNTTWAFWSAICRARFS
ncbi:hypothetical protein QBC34DRAFT_412741 [Podospora aff. communis PSN243]|uniref:Uncharacterized protein n=1 Tax=Podospora aff. communis PSN243 TaxID=3040156 RepID=A0AAV9GCC5_9PEZI|nr:hypothetical protein QBC34DRAFT_412741 [Podospora aff. communis PSN243]